MDVQIERSTFSGHYGSDTITFVCIKGGGYAIRRNDETVGVWGMTDYAYCLNIFLRMIERSAAGTAGVVAAPAELLTCHMD